MNITKVSIIISSYNKADYTVEAVKRALEQSYENIEVIVIDDYSTDDTQEKIRPFLCDKLIYIYQSSNQGVSASRNRGIKQATGEYIALLDCDDYYCYDKIEQSIRFLELHRQYFMVYTNAYIITQPYVWESMNGIERDILGFREYKPKFRNLLFHNYICNSTTVIKKEIFKKIGLFDEEMFICADWDMWLRISEQYEIGHLDMALSCVRSYYKEIII